MTSLGLAIALMGAAQGSPEITMALQQHIAQRHGVTPEDVVVGSLGLGVLPPCAAGAQVGFESRPAEDFRGHGDVRLRLLGSDGLCGSWSLRPRVTVFKNVPVAAAGVAQGQDVASQTQRMAITDIDGTPVDPHSGPWMARRNLALGTPLTHRTVQARPAAESGAEVVLLAGSGGLMVRASGRLVGDAALGETVRVTNLATRTVVTGVLIDPHTVRTGALR